uniref:Uncharacterized protein n=1 Tax=Denticeps clupeoides TaxID=299321 RepID=A0AAY4C5G7_9TELE
LQTCGASLPWRPRSPRRAASFAAFLLLCFLPLRFWGGRWHSNLNKPVGVWRLPELKTHENKTRSSSCSEFTKMPATPNGRKLPAFMGRQDCIPVWSPAAGVHTVTPSLR